MTRDVIFADGAPHPSGPYSHAVKGGELLYLSGQSPNDPGTGLLIEGDITAQTERVFANLAAVLAGAGRSFDDVVKVNVYLVDMADFPAMNAVYARTFNQPYPARTTVAVAALPLAASVEIEIIAT